MIEHFAAAKIGNFSGKSKKKCQAQQKLSWQIKAWRTCLLEQVVLAQPLFPSWGKAVDKEQ